MRSYSELQTRCKTNQKTANFPDKIDIQRCCEDVGAFLKESTKEFLKKEFDDITLGTMYLYINNDGVYVLPKEIKGFHIVSQIQYLVQRCTY